MVRHFAFPETCIRRVWAADPKVYINSVYKASGRIFSVAQWSARFERRQPLHGRDQSVVVSIRTDAVRTRGEMDVLEHAKGSQGTSIPAARAAS